jgi:hypothetical protein
LLGVQQFIGIATNRPAWLRRRPEALVDQLLQEIPDASQLRGLPLDDRYELGPLGTAGHKLGVHLGACRRRRRRHRSRSLPEELEQPSGRDAVALAEPKDRDGACVTLGQGVQRVAADAEHLGGLRQRERRLLDRVQRLGHSPGYLSQLGTDQRFAEALTEHRSRIAVCPRGRARGRADSAATFCYRQTARPNRNYTQMTIGWQPAIGHSCDQRSLPLIGLRPLVRGRAGSAPSGGTLRPHCLIRASSTSPKAFAAGWMICTATVIAAK